MAVFYYFYGMAKGSSHGAQRLYAETFPHRRIPNARTFVPIHQRLCEHGRFLPFRGNAGQPLQENFDDVEDRILHRVQNDPRISIRRMVA